jgi:excisionase family DNA binding protein
MNQPNFSSLSLGAQEKLLTPAEVAALFRVDPKTVTRWAKAGKLTSIKTLGGHRRYKESEVKALLKSITPSASDSTQRLGGN